MKKVIYLIITIFLIYSCSPSNNKQIEQLSKENKKLRAKLNQLESERKRLGGDASFYQSSLKDLQKRFDSLVFETSPIGLTLGEYYASDNNIFKFGRDSLVHLSWGTDDYELGKLGGSIIMHFFIGIYQEGIGEPLPPPPNVPANYQDQYNEYKQVEVSLDKQMELSWTEIKDLLAENKEYPYEKLGYDKTLDLSEYLTDVKGDL